MMIEPVTLLATFITLWAQLHNYGIDVEANENLRNIRVRRDSYGLRNQEQRQNYQGNSLILNSIYNGRDDANERYKLQDKKEKGTGQLKSIFRSRRSYKTNYNGNNYRQITYIEGKVPLANYSPDSPYYSQNTDGVPYIYTSYNNNIGNGYNNVGNGNNNIDNGNNNLENGNNNIGNGNKLSNQHKTATNRSQSPVATQQRNVNIYYDIATTTDKSNGKIMQRMSQYAMPSKSFNPNNTNNGYHYTQGTTVTSSGYQNIYNQGINYNSYPNRNTSQSINSGSRQFYNPFGGQTNGNNNNGYGINNAGNANNGINGYNSQTNGYNQTNGNNRPGINNNGYGINNAGNANHGMNGYNSQTNGYNQTNGNNRPGINNNGYGINNGGNANKGINGYNNTGNQNNNGGIWNYNTGFVNNNTNNGSFNTGNLNSNTGIWNGDGSFNGGAINNNAGNGNSNAGNGNNNDDNGKNNTEIVKISYIMSGVGCPEFFKSVSLFGKRVCLEDIDY